MPYIIKRYPNRKLYDPQASRYVTLDELKKLIQDGTELRVEDAASGEDLTSLTLAQILLEGERTHQATLPAMLLHQLIRNGEAWYDFVQRLSRSGSFGQFPLGPADAERFWNQWSAFAAWPSAAGRPTKPADAAPSDAASPVAETPHTSVAAEIAALKEQLTALEKQVTRRNRAGRKPPTRTPKARRR